MKAAAESRIGGSGGAPCRDGRTACAAVRRRAPGVPDRLLRFGKDGRL